jgi:hypothetical protein
MKRLLKMTNNKTPLQEAIWKEGELIKSDPAHNIVIGYERFCIINNAAQSYADLPSKIEGILVNARARLVFRGDNPNALIAQKALDDILNILKEGESQKG